MNKNDFEQYQSAMLPKANNSEICKSSVIIVDYCPEYQPHFSQLNREWIERFFEMETVDREILDEPEKHILAGGGAILFAASDNRIIGTVALVAQPDATFEMVKMAVADSARGRGVGKLLGRAIIERARDLGARRVILYSNTVLEPAINLYRALGFREVPVENAHYNRANIKMELLLGGE